MKNIVVLVQKEENGFRFLKRIKIAVDRAQVNYKGKVFPIDVSHPTYLTKKDRLYIIDYETREQYNFKQLEKSNPTRFQIVDSLITKRTIAQLLSEEPAWHLISLIIGVVIGVLLGILVGVMFL